MPSWPGGGFLSRIWSKPFLFNNLKPKPRRMEVTKENFEARLPEVIESIKDAEFVAIDGEFTGLTNGNRNSALDTPSERYLKAAANCRQFLLVQFGLCTFHYDHAKDRYTNRAYNFYVWPKPHSRAAPDLRFSCQTSSIDFLTSQNFDFNKLFRDGIPYLSGEQEAKLRATLTEKQEKRRENDAADIASANTPNRVNSIPIPEEQREYIDSVISQIEEFRKQLKSTDGETEDSSSLDLAKSNAFQRRLVFQTVRERYTDVYAESVNSNPNDKTSARIIRLTKATQASMRAREEARSANEMADLDSAVGFSKVIQALSTHRKPVVGHNMLLDLCFTVNQFVAALPEDYEEFKAMTNQTFPSLIDTKLLATSFPFKEDIPYSSLEELKTTLSEGAPFQMPEVKAAEPDAGYEGSERYHEAGYDAFITGLCFLGLTNRLGQLSQDRSSKHPTTGRPRVPPTSPLLSPFVNKLHLMRVQDVPYMNLGGDDVEPDRSHVFHVQFPSQWKTIDVSNAFEQFGSVFVSWIDDSSAYVTLNCRDLAPSVMSALSNSFPDFTIMPYKQFKSLERTVSLSSSQSSAGSSGITPMLEKSAMFGTPPVPSKKRALGHDESGDSPRVDFKRTKSVTEAPKSSTEAPKAATPLKKTFEEASWD